MKPVLLTLLFCLLIMAGYCGKADSLTIKSELRKLDKSALSWQDKEVKARELIRLSAEAGYPDGEMHASYILAMSFFFRQQYQAAFGVLDSLLGKLDSNAEDVRGRKDIENKKARVYTFMGTIFDEIGDYTKAMDWYLKSLKYVELQGDAFQKAVLYKNLGMTNLVTGNVPKANEYFQRSLAICDSTGDKKTEFDILNALQEFYVEKKNYDSALLYGYKLLGIARQVGEDYSVALANYSLGNVYRASGSMALAEAFLQETLTISEKNNFRPLMSQSLLGLSMIQTGRGNRKAALDMALRAYEIAEPTQVLTLNIATAERLYSCYADMDDFANAYKISLKYQHYKDEDNLRNNSKAVTELQARYDMDKINNEKRMLEGELMLKQSRLENQKLSLFASVVGILLLLALLVMQVRKYRHVRELNFKLENQQMVINEQAVRLHNEQEQLLKLEIEHKNREMTSIALALAQENEFKQNLIDELGKFKQDATLKKSELQNLNSIIGSIKQQMSGNSWEEFRTYFENVYSTFYNNIESEYPQLSQNDKRLCAMLKLGLSTKEISLLTYREVKSVESARNRLRKKFKLDPKENLPQFLTRF
ncbi:MAG TPA: tetratricopeptide repeat protein [Lentimicrobium sp.]|nr:tetratricopeptide repeat protein [Lentimicrobium sp.]